MIVKRRHFLTGLALGLSFLFLLSIPVRAQDRNDIGSLASELSNAANESWNAMRYSQNSGEFGNNPSARQLYWLMRDFSRRANHFAQESREPWEQTGTLRSEARQLINQARRIDNLMFEANVPDSILQEWSEVDDSIANIADTYNLPYDRDRGLARRDYDDYQER